MPWNGIRGQHGKHWGLAMNKMGMMAFFTVVACFGGVCVAGDKESLQGTWSCTAASRDGKNVAAEIAEKLTVTVEGDKITVHDGKSKKKEPSRFSLDSSANPKEIDITPERGEAASIKGIYKLEGKQLKICWRQGGRERPTSFETKDGDGKIIFELKQQ